MPKLSDFRVDVLCEDANHFQFIRAFLKENGVNDRKIDADIAENAGSGEQFVREKLPQKLKDIRNKRSRGENVLLIVLTDADKLFVAERKNQLREYIKQSKLNDISDSDNLLVIIPKRNLETWFKWLDADISERQCINEDTDYKLKYKKAKASLYGKKLDKIYKDMRGKNAKTCEYPIESLKTACDDYENFLNLIMRKTK